MFSKDLSSVTFPPKFNPSLPSRYDGTTPPLDFPQLYSLTVCAAKGDDKCMANWMPMALKGAAITWLMNFPEESIHSYEELCLQFVANFKGSYEHHLTLHDLRAVRQHSNETLRQYLQRFCQTHHKIKIGRAHV